MRCRAGVPTEQQHGTGGTGSQSSPRYARSHRRSERRIQVVRGHFCSRYNVVRKRQASMPSRLELNSSVVFSPAADELTKLGEDECSEPAAV